VLVVDLPPGTGDVPLSLAQSVVVNGAVVVTTPQRLAALEAAKAAEMFTKLNVPVLGVVENMSWAQCECGRRSYPFGRVGGEWLAVHAGVRRLCAVPLEEAVRAGRGAVRVRPALVPVRPRRPRVARGARLRAAARRGAVRGRRGDGRGHGRAVGGGEAGGWDCACVPCDRGAGRAGAGRAARGGGGGT